MSTATEPIALCLSGGGLRATLFHLGVIRALRGYELGDELALKRVTQIFAVSGGSILAAHMLVNYARYTGSDAEFEKVADEIVAFVNRDIRNRVLRRWGLTGWIGLNRGHWLQREYRKLLGDAKLSACYAQADLPKFHFLTTNFNTGELCSFSGTQFEKTRRAESKAVTDRTAAGSLPLAYAVAASSAFPPMFPPVTLTPDMLGRPENPEFAMAIELSDGGVYDNFGIEKFCLAQRDAADAGALVVSHAGGSFDTVPGKTYATMLSRNIRASDIMMRRVGDTTLETGAEIGGAGYTLIRIGATVEDRSLEVETQNLLRLVRTDLDRFAPKLARMLVDHGSRVGWNVLDGRGWKLGPRAKLKRDERQDAELAKIARDAGRRKVDPLFLDFRDIVWLAVWWVLVASLVAAGAYGTLSYVRAKAEEQRLIEDRRNALNRIEAQLEKARDAAARNNFDDTKRALAVAITTTQDLGNDSPNDIAAKTAPPIDAAQVQQIIEDAPAVPTLATSAYPQRVFIHFAGELTRAEITSLNVALKQAGWRTEGPSGQRISTAAGRNEVRYSGDNALAAAHLAGAIQDSGVVARKVELKPLSIIHDDVLEVWISR